MTHVVLTRQALASRYVKRCALCRVVRGNSAYNTRRGGLADICRFCGGDAKYLRELRREEKRLSSEMDAVRAKIARLMVDANQSTLELGA